MNLICVFFFNLLLLNGHLTASVNRESTSSYTQHQNEDRNYTKSRVLNEDFEYAIFDNSDLMDILHFAKNPRYSEFVIKHIFPVKYHNYLFIIFPSDDNVQWRSRQQPRGYDIYGENFYIDIIKYFGESIHQLQIANTGPMNDGRLPAVYEKVNEYCSESLNYLNIRLKETAFEEFKKPFSNVVDLEFVVFTDEIGSFVTLNEIFPKLQKLSFALYRSTEENEFVGSRFIESELPLFRTFGRIHSFY